MGSQLAALTEKMQNVQSFSAAAQPIDSALTVSLPLANNEALDEFEKQLTDDGSLLPPVVAKLARKGGKTVRKAVEKMLSSLLSNELMTSMNWTGACGKTAYSKLKCYEFVQQAVRRYVRTAGATDDDIKDEVMRYLHGSGDREGSRAERTSRKRLRHLKQRCEAENESP